MVHSYNNLKKFVESKRHINSLMIGRKDLNVLSIETTVTNGTMYKIYIVLYVDSEH